jgi:cytochrome c-type biogenesis protein CcmH/NrfG
MDQTTFSPKINKIDTISPSLFRLARWLMVVMISLLPIFFIPGMSIFGGSSKIFFVALVLFVVIIISSLGILRKGSLSMSFSPVLLAWWGVVLASLLSAILSPTLLLSLVDNNLGLQTVGFLVILGLVMMSATVFTDAKKSLVYVYGALFGGAVLLSVFQIIRIFFGSGVLTFGFLQSNTATLIGSFNDLGIFLALAIILSLVFLIQLPLQGRGVAIIGLCIGLMLFLLVIINFFALWAILSLLSLTLLMYCLTKDRIGVDSDNPSARHDVSLPVTGLIAGIFIVSAFFLIGGSSLSGYISSVTNVNYTEVRPSVTATIDIMRNVYSENAFTGIGPNRFSDAWSLYKNPSINQTIFWNTLFTSGSGYVPTWFVTTGIFGVLAWLLFFVMFLYTGLRTFTQGKVTDHFWYFIGTISFVTALYVWIISVIYVPGLTLLVIGAFSTGVMLVARRALVPSGQKAINLITNARMGFVLIAVAMIVIITTVGSGYVLFRQFASQYTYASITNIPANENQFSTASTRLVNSLTLYPSDFYARELAILQLQNINYLLSLGSTTSSQQQEFQRTVSDAIQAANEAVRINPNDSRNWSILGNIYSTLAIVKIDGAAGRAKSAYEEARKLDPQNPYYDFQEAVVAFRTNDNETARNKAMSALQLKQNYTEALFLISQIDINNGDINKAIETTRAILSLDAYNPGLYFQLGVLESANKNSPAAIAAYSQAIALNPNYANARYLRAEQYVITGDKDNAINDLTVVSELNPDNASVRKIIEEVKGGNLDSSMFGTGSLITEPSPSVDSNQVTTATDVPQTDLVTPVNISSSNNSQDDAVPTISDTALLPDSTTQTATTTTP